MAGDGRPRRHQPSCWPEQPDGSGGRSPPPSRGGASDASHFAASIDWTVDGLGPRGGDAHNPGEFVLTASLQERAEVALALAGEVLARVS